MDERGALLAAITREPADDTPRLVYADWLDEHEEHDRAAFIRVQIELARGMTGPDPMCLRCYGGGGLLHRTTLKPTPCLDCFANLRSRETALRPAIVAPLLISGAYLHFQRGFIAVVECPVEMWLATAGLLMTLEPVPCVRLSAHHPRRTRKGSYVWDAYADPTAVPRRGFQVHGALFRYLPNRGLSPTEKDAYESLSYAALEYGRRAALLVTAGNRPWESER
jgi:uncharacterized protein (TIGR02996 family)